MRTTDAERFWAKVQKTPICWLWTAGTTKSGHGVFGVAQSTTCAHRWAYEALIGPIPEGLELDHRCRVPQCVNPTHLEPVTRGENQRRATYARALLSERATVIYTDAPGFLGIDFTAAARSQSVASWRAARTVDAA